MLNTYVGNEPMVIGFNGEVNKNIDFSFGENTEDGFEKITNGRSDISTIIYRLFSKPFEGVHVMHSNI